MRIIKVVVVGMGVIIIVGYLVLAYALFSRSTGHEDTKEKQLLARGTALAEPPGNALNLPPGTRIGEMLVVGDHLVFRVTIPDGPDQLYAIEPRTSTLWRMVSTGAGPASASGH
jgi:hypothetical protein